MGKPVVIAVAGMAAIAVVFSVANAREKPASSLSSCVSSPVIDTQIIDDSTLMVVDRSGHAARLTLTGPCLRDRDAPVQIRYNGNGDRLCHAADVDITSGRGVPLTCAVKHVDFMTLEEARGALNN